MPNHKRAEEEVTLSEERRPRKVSEDVTLKKIVNYKRERGFQAKMSISG